MTGLNKNTSQNKSLPPLEGVKEEFLKAVEAWESEELRIPKGYVAYFCPVCTRVEEVSERGGAASRRALCTRSSCLGSARLTGGGGGRSWPAC